MANYSIYHNANFQSFVRQDYRPLIVESNYEEIINQARSEQRREVNQKLKNATVYAGEYGQKQLDGTTRSKMRPSSPTRKNNPHPPQIFMITKLHNQPGYYDCEKGTLAKSGNSSLYLQHKDILNGKKNKVEIFSDQRLNFAAEAWMKLASDKDRAAVQKMMDFVTESHEKHKEIPDKRRLRCQALIQLVKPELSVSAHRWLKEAGVYEIASVEKLMNTLSTAPDQQKPLTFHRAEYVVHPEWRTNFS
ncbi:uncharacterized protein LOC108699458 [Xenopus laevis]|uniref:Uncharacterized protein n=2 Tax=Xenopus laevis TaxID=8355 RepID=A0A974I372_XENLA|nr:uncharacterized protein LOC108699458 [Xenopus laevis]OCT99740.1 hypothetical protein XELAEV_18005521mg [Xenopus laevis]